MIEHANCYRSVDTLEAMFSRLHPSVVQAVNARRRTMRLPEIRTKGDPTAPPMRRTLPGGLTRAAGDSWRPRSLAERQALVSKADATLARVRGKLRAQRFAALMETCRRR